jgi:hypothetical protein
MSTQFPNGIVPITNTSLKKQLKDRSFADTNLICQPGCHLPSPLLKGRWTKFANQSSLEVITVLVAIMSWFTIRYSCNNYSYLSSWLVVSNGTFSSLCEYIQIWIQIVWMKIIHGCFKLFKQTNCYQNNKLIQTDMSGVYVRYHVQSTQRVSSLILYTIIRV